MSWFSVRIFSLGIGFWVIVLLSLWKYYDIPFGPPWFLMTNWCHSNCFPLLSDFVVLSFQKFNYDVSIWISLGLSYWEFDYLLEPLGVCLLPNLGSFQALLLWIFFQSHPFLLSFWDSDNPIRSFVIVPQASQTLFTFFFHSISSILFRLGISVILSFNSLILSSVSSILLLNPFAELFISYCIFLI